MIIKIKILFAVVILSCVQLSAEVSTGVDANIIEATKNIKYLSQNIAKEYLHLYKHPTRIKTKTKLQNNIKELEDNFRFVAKNTNNEDSKNVLDFLSYSKDQIKEILENEIKAENQEQILDQVEALSEGAESILSSYNYDALSDTDIKINLANISKFYMAIDANINPSTNKDNIENEIKIVDLKLKNASVTAKNSWHTLKTLLTDNRDKFIPNIVSILIKNLENLTKS